MATSSAPTKINADGWTFCTQCIIDTYAPHYQNRCACCGSADNLRASDDGTSRNYRNAHPLVCNCAHDGKGATARFKGDRKDLGPSVEGE